MKPQEFAGESLAAVGRGVVAVVVDDAVGGSHADAVIEALRPRYGDALMLVPAKGDAAALIDRVLGTLRPRMIVACGDDELVAAIAAACYGRAVELAIVPVGTSTIARALGIPCDREAACAAIRRGNTGLFDVLMVGRTLVLGRVLFGRFSELERCMQSPRPWLSRVWSILGELFGYRVRFELEVDGTDHRVRATSVVATNSGAIGYGNLQWSPGIDPDDGRFDAVIVHSSTIFDYAALLWSWITHRPRARQLTHMRVHRKLRVRTRRPVGVTVDGRHGRVSELTVELAPEQLRIVVPEVGVLVDPAPVRARAPVVPTAFASCG